LLDISQGWKFRIGDQVNWSRADLDDSAWKSIKTGQPWETQGHPGYDGYAWYRLRLTVPSTWQEHAEFHEKGALAVSLGRIDDVDETWFNGTKIGGTGIVSDHYQSRWQALRRYVLPAELIRWGSENVLAVRVYDGSRAGGMYSGACSVSIASWTDLLHVRFDLRGGDGTFDQQQPPEIAVKIRNGSSKPTDGRLLWTVRTDEGKRIFETGETPRVKLQPGEEKLRSRALPLPGPGFYRVDCEWVFAEGTTIAGDSMVMGYRPGEIESPLTREQDFDAFWIETKKQLSKVDPRFKMIRIPDRDSKSHEVYEVKMQSLGNVQVAGWYERPKGNQPVKVPAVLRVPGYGSSMFPTGRAEPYVFFSFNVRGHGNSQKDVKGAPENYWIRGLDDKTGYFYQGAYADCIRALDFLVTQPEVDSERIAVTGGSQGGGLSLATAALDDRIHLCAPDIPFLCDWKKYFEVRKWPEIDQWIDAGEERTWQSTLRTLSYFDTLNMADRIKCPVVVGIGLQDGVCPAHTILAVYNRLGGEKSCRIYARSAHRVEAGHEGFRYRWMEEHFSD